MADQVFYQELAESVFKNLENQHDWTEVQIHKDLHDQTYPRPLLSGLPPNRLYLHPDDQIELVKSRTTFSQDEAPETEWVLPTHINEKLSLRTIAAVFDSMGGTETLKPGRCKRILLATVHDDSTIVYYFIHDGIVKPRQN